MIKRPLLSFSSLSTCLYVAFGSAFLISCSSDKDKPYLPVICTPSSIIGEVSEGSFKDPATQMPLSVALTNTFVRCSEDTSHEEVKLYVRLLVKRQSQSEEDATYKIPYFVVLSKEDHLVLKENLEAEVKFDKTQKRLVSLSSSPLKLHLDKTSHPEDYTLYVGLQINEEQLDKNYAKREQTPDISSLKRSLPKTGN